VTTAKGESGQAAVPAAAVVITGLLNSRRHAYSTDQLDSPEEAAAVVRSLAQDGEAASGADATDGTDSVDDGLIARLRALREDLVAALDAESSSEREQAWARFTADSRDVTVWHDFGTPGQVRRRRSTGSPAEATVVLAAAALVSDGTWSRVKLCANDLCGSAFYDITRSRTQRWHSYEVCGNRHNVAAHRARRGSSA
jgi:predicted RNA-binding Zn ribbon-like protein